MRNEKNTRSCRNCRIKKNKLELFRIAKDLKNGTIELDDKYILQSRGIYFCSEDCFLKSFKKDIIHKTLKQKLTEEEINKIKEKMKK